MKTSITIIVLIVLAIVFLPMYKGVVHCGFNPGMPCINEKLNLIEYIQYKRLSEQKGLQECPDEMILNKMPRAEIQKMPSSYYTQDGVRREIYEYDHVWVRNNCTVPVQEVY